MTTTERLANYPTQQLMEATRILNVTFGEGTNEAFWLALEELGRRMEKSAFCAFCAELEAAQ